MLYRIVKDGDKSKLEPARGTSMPGERFREVQDLERWVCCRPELLLPDDEGPPPIFVATRVRTGRFELDILALDADGTLVIGELKRDEGNPLDQAIGYAGRLSGMPTNELLALIERNSEREIRKIEVALDLPQDQTLADVLDGPNRSIRVVLIAAGYTREVLDSALWLRGSGIDLTAIRFDIFEANGEFLFFPEVLIPSQETARRYQAQQEKARWATSRRTRNSFASLIGREIIKVGEKAYDEQGQELGVVREEDIQKTDGTTAVNASQLTGGIASLGYVFFERNGEFKSLKQLKDELGEEC